MYFKIQKILQIKTKKDILIRLNTNLFLIVFTIAVESGVIKQPRILQAIPDIQVSNYSAGVTSRIPLGEKTTLNAAWGFWVAVFLTSESGISFTNCLAAGFRGS